jgi:tetratricopeptide (TPR) repeat protein
MATVISACGAAAREPSRSLAHAAPTATATARSSAPSPISLGRTIVTPEDAASVEELFARSRAAFTAGRFKEAAEGFQRIVDLDPDGPFAKEAWLHGAAAHDALGDLAGAVARYQEVARRYSKDPAARDALVRSVRLLTYLERWPAAGEAADVLLGRLPELSPLERIVALSGKALSLVFSDQPDAAEYFIAKGRDIVEAERLDAAGAFPRDLAELYFALGELRRIRGERIHLESAPQNFARVLEQRCQLLLDAQSAYSDAMRAYDAHWSAMAGYRVGELYEKLHGEIMRIAPPGGAAGPAKAQLFEGAMRLRYSVLLQKGLTMMDHTLAMAERTGEHSAWVVRAAEAKKVLERGALEEAAALARLPYSRVDLEKALDNLAKGRAK